jgi:RNA polymerase sigma factor (sigma-70 family)
MLPERATAEENEAHVAAPFAVHPRFALAQVSLLEPTMNTAVDQGPAERPPDAKAREAKRPDKPRLEQLLSEMRAGSSAAAQELIRKYGPHIRAAIQRKLDDSLRPMFDSEDFVQSAWKSLIGMPHEKVGEIHNPDQLIKLMTTIAARKVIDQFRKRTNPGHNVKRRRSLEHPDVVAALAKIAGINTPSQICIARERYDHYRRRWENMVNQQTERDRRIIHLRLGGVEFPEIAEVEEISERHARRIVNGLMARLYEAERAA